MSERNGATKDSIDASDEAVRVQKLPVVFESLEDNVF